MVLVKNVKVTFDEVKATELIIDVKGNVDYYAKTLLNIFNHIREFPHVFFNVHNFRDNRIAIIVAYEERQNVANWLMNFEHDGNIEQNDVVIFDFNFIGANYIWDKRIDSLYESNCYDIIPRIQEI